MGMRFYMALLACTVTVVLPAHADQLLYVAAVKDNAILAYELNPTTGELGFKCKTVLQGSPGVMTSSPDGSIIYAAVNDDGQAKVATLKRSPDGCLSVLGVAKLSDSSSTAIAYLCTDQDGRFLLTADYSAGEVTVYRIVDGRCTGEVVDHKTTEHSAHCVELDPSGDFVFVPHVKPNKIYQFRFDKSKGTLTPNEPPFVDGPDKEHRYHDPRNYVHHPKLDIGYTSNENGSGITVWNFDRRTGTLQRGTTLSALPPDSSGDLFAAGIQMTPNGRFAYVANRDQTADRAASQREDTLAGFLLDPDSGEPALIGYWPTPNQPFSFCIDRSGRFVYVAGTDTSTLCAYRIDQNTGKLEQFATYETGELPLWVICQSALE